LPNERRNAPHQVVHATVSTRPKVLNSSYQIDITGAFNMH